MKHLIFGAIIFALCLCSCNHNSDHNKSLANADTTKSAKFSDISNDKKEIQDLIRKVLILERLGKVD